MRLQDLQPSLSELRVLRRRLPETLVYSAAERFALQHEEEERSLEKARRSAAEDFSITSRARSTTRC